jgi:hypothetical protein
MDAAYYSLAFAGSDKAPVQLARSIQSLRMFSADLPVFVFLLGEPPSGFVEMLRQLNATVRLLGDYRDYIARTEPGRADLFALNPTLHKWLVLEEPELKRCERLIYLDSDTFFFDHPNKLLDRYGDAGLFAREEPLCRRSIHGYDPSYLDEDAIADLCERDGLRFIPPFNTGICLFTRQMADTITMNLPHYFNYLFRFLSWFRLHPVPGEPTTDFTQMIEDRFRIEAEGQALSYPSRNRWIVDQVALWLALGRSMNVSVADFAPSDVWQGAEFKQISARAKRPILSHYFGENSKQFFELLQPLFQRRAQAS